MEATIQIKIDYQFKDGENIYRAYSKYLKVNSTKIRQMILQDVNREIAVIMQNDMFQAIDAFYADYTPGTASQAINKWVYSRTYGLYSQVEEIDIASNGFVKTEFNGETIPIHPHMGKNFSIGKLFDLTIINGYHGGPMWRSKDHPNATQMSPSPGDLFSDSYNAIDFAGICKEITNKYMNSIEDAFISAYNKAR